MTDKYNAGRLAFREEGAFWNCYYAEMDTMKNAVLIGSIRMVLIVDNGKTKRQFQQTMKDCFEYLVETATGSKVDHWTPEKTAPFWEKKE